MVRVELRARVVPRASIPADASVESWLTVRLASAAAEGRLDGPVGVVVRERTVELVDLGAARQAGLPASHLLSGLTTTDTAGGRVEAVGLWGLLEKRRRGDPGGVVPMAVVFLEWEDCRWWMWSARLAEAGIDEASIDERAAVDGDAMPDGLGRWWTHARRARMQARLDLHPPTVH